MGSLLRYEQCPRCAERGKDSHKDNLGVFSDGGLWCFACGYKKGPPLSSLWDGPSLAKEEKTKRIIPQDYTRLIPTVALQWLMGFGLPYSYWMDMIGWSPSHERLVFKVGHPTLFSTGRYFGVDSNDRKWYTWGDVHKHAAPTGVGTGDKIVLVEDLISAHKVGQVTETLPLFGTRIHPDHLYYLKITGKPIIIWLDKDQEDRMPRMAANLQLLADLPVQYVVTEKDPKGYDTRKIDSILEHITF